jgi:hypothetical protein
MTYLPLLPDVVILYDNNKIESFYPLLNRFLFFLSQTFSFNETIDNGTTAKNKTIKVTQPKKQKGHQDTKNF